MKNKRDCEKGQSRKLNSHTKIENETNTKENIDNSNSSGLNY